MSLKDNLIDELQKLRISREKPKCLQQKTWAKEKKTKQSKIKQEAHDLLASLEETNESESGD